MSLKDYDDEVKAVRDMTEAHNKAASGQELPNPFENVGRYTTTLSLTAKEYEIIRKLKVQGVTLIAIFRRGLREYS